MRSKSTVVLAAVLLLVATVAPAVAAPSDSALPAEVDGDTASDVVLADAENGTVTGNDSLDGNDTDGNATDGNATDGNSTADANASVEADDAFGVHVSAFVRQLLNGTDEQRHVGRLIAGWVTANNPGNASDHAGPPTSVGPPEEAGPPENAGRSGEERGPPANVTGGETADGEANATDDGRPEDPGEHDERGGDSPADRDSNGEGRPADPGSNGAAKGHGR